MSNIGIILLQYSCTKERINFPITSSHTPRVYSNRSVSCSYLLVGSNTPRHLTGLVLNIDTEIAISYLGKVTHVKKISIMPLRWHHYSRRTDKITTCKLIGSSIRAGESTYRWTGKMVVSVKVGKTTWEPTTCRCCIFPSVHASICVFWRIPVSCHLKRFDTTVPIPSLPPFFIWSRCKAFVTYRFVPCPRVYFPVGVCTSIP